MLTPSQPLSCAGRHCQTKVPLSSNEIPRNGHWWLVLLKVLITITLLFNLCLITAANVHFIANSRTAGTKGAIILYLLVQMVLKLTIIVQTLTEKLHSLACTITLLFLAMIILYQWKPMRFIVEDKVAFGSSLLAFKLVLAFLVIIHLKSN